MSNSSSQLFSRLLCASPERSHVKLMVQAEMCEIGDEKEARLRSNTLGMLG